ncbi:MAG TPA: hypothetical protein DCM44_13230 [Pantoea sp.]|uniref:hypothetical protein n=1 Tax=Pantoea TaxID=53335 RepID=UPI000534B85C|nr:MULTISPECIES: hypothetical protein [Pantoea]MDU6089789.1 hypothetical protein [Staphylococcus lugdunensis]PNK64573.1 hypothetical protein A6J33_018175 [Pantoea sp. FDAARGOS_194]HAK35488.1 hypothetical protein [Pantoea sp.]
MEKVHDIDSMVAGIMAFVHAARQQRASDDNPKDVTEIYMSAGFDVAIELAEKCAEAIAAQKGATK